MEIDRNELIEIKSMLGSLPYDKDEDYAGVWWSDHKDNPCLITFNELNEHKTNNDNKFKSTKEHFISLHDFVIFIHKRYQMEIEGQKQFEKQQQELQNKLKNMKQNLDKLFDEFTNYINKDPLVQQGYLSYCEKFFKDYKNGNLKPEDGTLFKKTVELIKSIIATNAIDPTKFQEKIKIDMDITHKTNQIEQLTQQIKKCFDTMQRCVIEKLPHINPSPPAQNTNPLTTIQNQSSELSLLSDMPIKPASFTEIKQVEINKGKSIPSINGIDIHPTKNMYIAMGSQDGELFIKDHNNNDIKKIQLTNNSNGAAQNCLWSPSGNKIMVSTMENHSIYIYDETGNMITKKEKTYSSDGFGAIWLSEEEVAIGYKDGTVKFFNTTGEFKETGSIKLSSGYAWGMENLDNSHLLVVHEGGTISRINWKNNTIEWKKEKYHSNGIRCLKLNKNKTLLLSGAEDKHVRLMKIHDQKEEWNFQMNGWVHGLVWLPGEKYVLALSYSNQLVALNSSNKEKLLEFNQLSSECCTLRLNQRTLELFIGDKNGIIRILKINKQEQSSRELPMNRRIKIKHNFYLKQTNQTIKKIICIQHTQLYIGTYIIILFFLILNFFAHCLHLVLLNLMHQPSHTPPSTTLKKNLSYFTLTTCKFTQLWLNQHKNNHINYYYHLKNNIFFYIWYSPQMIKNKISNLIKNVTSICPYTKHILFGYLTQSSIIPTHNHQHNESYMYSFTKQTTL